MPRAFPGKEVTRGERGSTSYRTLACDSVSGHCTVFDTDAKCPRAGPSVLTMDASATELVVALSRAKGIV